MRKIVFGLVVTLLSCTTTLVAQDAGQATEKDPGQRATAMIMKSFKKAKLTEEQQASAKAIVDKNLEAFLEAKKVTDSLLTKEKVTMQRAAMKKGRADGLKGSELIAAGLAATGLTDEEMASYTEAKKNVDSISMTVKTEIMGLLTDEQKASVPSKGKGRKGKKGKGKGKKGKGKKGKKKDDAEEVAE